MAIDRGGQPPHILDLTTWGDKRPTLPINGPFSWSGNDGETGTFTYSFDATKDFYSGQALIGKQTPQILFKDTQDSVVSALWLWRNVASLNFSVNNTSPSLVFSEINTPGANGLFLPFTINNDSDLEQGDIYFDNGLSNTNPGGDGYATIIHEIGHSLGLSHPGGGADDANPNYSRASTVMSGLQGVLPSGTKVTTPMIYDIAAAQFLYGAHRTYFSGHSTYNFSGDSVAWTVWDAGGIDHFNAYGISGNVKLDLRGGVDENGDVRFSEVGDERIAIAFDAENTVTGMVDIENATGGQGNDEIIGNSLDNVLIGGILTGADKIAGSLGSDFISGGGGDDILAGFWLDEFGDAPGNSAEDGDDIIHGDEGDDELVGLVGEDVLIGGPGEDTLWGGSETRMYGGEAPANNEDGTIPEIGEGGGFGADDEEADQFIGGNGAATFIVGTNDIVWGGLGNDTIYAIGADVIGDEGGGPDEGDDDTIYAIDSQVWGEGGDDTIFLKNTTEDEKSVIGGDGDNTIILAGGENLVVYTGNGHNTISIAPGVKATVYLAGDFSDEEADGYTKLDIMIGDQLINDPDKHYTGDSDGGDENHYVIGEGYIVGVNGYNGSVINLANGTDVQFYWYSGWELNDGWAPPRLAYLDGMNDYSEDADTIDTPNPYSGSETLDQMLASSGTAGDDSIEGTDDADNYSGGFGNDIINSLLGADLVAGGPGDDVVSTGDDNDTIIAGSGAGNDTYDGGDDVDNVVYSSALLGVTVNLALGTASGSETGSDTLSNIENVIGGFGGDSITGNSGANSLDGKDGDDTLNGGDGNDTLTGGTGTDWASFAGGAAVSVNLSAGTATGQGSDTLSGIENVLGSSNADTITGNSDANSLDGADGADSIQGGDGDDTLSGAAAADSLDGGNGEDTLIGSDGNDTLIGGADTDWASFAGGAAVTVNLSAGTATGQGSDTLSGIENVLGSSNADTITGSTSADVLDGSGGADTMQGSSGEDMLDGGDGNDTLNGGSENDSLSGGADADSIDGGDGNDFLDGGDGNDTIIGGLGTDWVSFASGAAVSVNLSTGTATGQGTDTLSGIENVIGSANGDTIIGSTSGSVLNGGEGADSLSGSSGSDSINGGLGNDTLAGSSGTDSLLGGADADSVDGGSGNDTLNGGDGNDTLAGGADTDTVSFAGGAAVTVSLSAGTATGQGTDTLSGFENIIGSENADNITGNSGTNSLDGGYGNDTVDGSSNNDTILGAAGADSLIGGSGDDSVDGGSEDDIIQGGSGNDTVHSGTGNDSVTGFTENDQLYGDDGDDTLNGGDGDDTLDGGANTDTVSFAGGAAVTVSLTSGTATGQGTDTLSNSLIGKPLV
jgi:Ca2+-binding RTX toxin-like protein